MTVLENLLVPTAKAAGRADCTASITRRAAIARSGSTLLESRPPGDPRADPGLDHSAVPARQIYGGQKKLLELARTLMARPSLILLDEPGAGVNPTLMRSLVSAIRALHERGMTFLVIEHDMDLVAELCDPVIVLAAGRTLAEGPFAEIRRDPTRARGLSGDAGVSASPRDRGPARGLRGPRDPARHRAARGGWRDRRDHRAERRRQVDAAQDDRRASVPARGDRGFRGEPIGRRPEAIIRRGLCYVPQEANVFPGLSVEDNLVIGGWAAAGASLPRAAAVSALFPVLAERRRQRAGSLSGGERQMLAIAMALMVEPALLLLDEPSAGLAPGAPATDLRPDRDINARGVGIVLVEQNARESLRLCRRGYVLVMGQTRAEGPGDELLVDPEIRRAYLGG